MTRRVTACTLIVLLTIAPVVQAAPQGTLKGVVTLQGRPLAGIQLALVEMESGAIQRVTSGNDGQFQTALVPGRYVVSAEGKGPIVIAEAPAYVPVSAGQVASARIDLAPVQVPPETPSTSSAPPANTPPGDKPVLGKHLTATQGQTTLDHDAVTCFIA